MEESKANNVNAFYTALSSFQTMMNTLVVVERPYVLRSTMVHTAISATLMALGTFDSMATMGKRSLINHYRERLVISLDEERARYVAGALKITMWFGCWDVVCEMVWV